MCATVAAGLGRESGPESAECDAGVSEFHPIFLLSGAPLLQRFWADVWVAAVVVVDVVSQSQKESSFSTESAV